MSLSKFSRNMKSIADNLETNVSKEMKKAALIIDRDVVIQTPVDTGRARSNWLVGIGAAIRDVIDALSPGEGLSAGERLNAQLSIDAARTEIEKHRPGQDIYISNNLSYIDFLNQGSSAQAPANFVEKAIQAGIASLKKSRVVKR